MSDGRHEPVIDLHDPPPDPWGVSQVRPKLGQRGMVILVTGALAIVLAAVMSMLPVPYAIYGPGPATDVLGTVDGKPLMTVSGARSYRPTGRGALEMTTVEVFGGPGSRVSLMDALRGWGSPDHTVVPRDLVFPPGQTASQVSADNVREMTDSQQRATAAGLREAGLQVPERVSIAGVQPDVPAADVLRVGDVITAVNGRRVRNVATIQSTVSTLASGAQVRLTVRRAAEVVRPSTRTTTVDGRTVLGVTLRSAYDFPATVRFANQDVGGPSAGLMFALGIYDLLTPGDLPGGQRVAGSGTIDGAGAVGPIGGIAQKMIGARAAGATWFLAPGDNCDDVVGQVPDGLRVVRVAGLHQARLAVQDIAAGRGAGLPSCSASR
ncbi:MAG: YlbL family protein [Angustibacter sp.]